MFSYYELTMEEAIKGLEQMIVSMTVDTETQKESSGNWTNLKIWITEIYDNEDNKSGNNKWTNGDC